MSDGGFGSINQTVGNPRIVRREIPLVDPSEYKRFTFTCETERNGENQFTFAISESMIEKPGSGGAYLATNIKDVALKAGVSIATVSHVLNGTRGTRPQTRQRVLAAIQELGYSQNQSARNLASGRSTLMGLVISDIRNPFFPEVTAAFQSGAHP